MQSCGNDYIYIYAENLRFFSEKKTAKSLSIRRLSVGSDGLVLIKKSKIADFKMQIYNSDGSEAKMCGNAIRCVGRFVYDKKLTDKKEITIETLSGVKTVKLFFKKGVCGAASVDIGKCKSIRWLFGENIEIFRDKFKIFLLSVGNPHAVLFTEKQIESIDLKGVAEYVNEKIYKGINVEIINKISDSVVKMRVFERGSGETLACGTGASASVGALKAAGVLSADKILVKLAGGNLQVNCDKQGILTLIGSVNTVYEGVIDLDGVIYAN